MQIETVFLNLRLSARHWREAMRHSLKPKNKSLLFPQYSYSALVEEYNAMVYVKRRDTFHVDSANDLFGE